MQRLKHLPAIYPFIFALFPLWALYNRNTASIRFNELLNYALLVVIGVLVVHVLLRLILKSKVSADLCTAALTIMLFYYKRIPERIRDRITDELVLRTVWIALFVCVVGLIIWLYRKPKFQRVLNGLSSYLGFLSLCFLAVTGYNFLRSPAVEQTPQVVELAAPQIGRLLQTNQIALAQQPDVFYIILDGYGRADVLKEYFGYDNSPFLNELKKLGFYVAEQSKSNYFRTHLSLPSSLNMDYIQALANNSITWNTISGLLARSEIFNIFNEHGFNTIFYPSGYSFFSKLGSPKTIVNLYTLDEFGYLFLNSTLLKGLPVFTLTARQHIISTMAALKDVPLSDKPSFVFAHIPMPHPPYLFNADGSPRDVFTSVPSDMELLFWEPREAYIGQITYLNQLVLDSVSGIMANAKRPVIIVIQGDHGPGNNGFSAHERMPILNAYYLPQGGDKFLYPSISPVNSFRLIFDLYFGSHFGLIDDIAYFSRGDSLTVFCPVDEFTSETVSSYLKTFLNEHNYRIKTDDCAFEYLIALRDHGFYDFVPEGEGFEKLAGKEIKVQLPVMEETDYLFSAHLKPANEQADNRIKVMVGDEVIDEQIVNSSPYDLRVTIPARLLRSKTLVEVKLIHSISQPDYRGIAPYETSAVYSWFGWLPKQYF
jgi:hypothetical protein